MSSRQMPPVPTAPVSYERLHGTLHDRRNNNTLKAAKRVVADIYALVQDEMERKADPERAHEAKIIDLGKQEERILDFLEMLREMMSWPNLISFPEYTVQCRKLESWISLYLADRLDLSGAAAAALSAIRTALAAPAEAPKQSKAKPARKPAPRGYVMDEEEEAEVHEEAYA